MPTPSDTPHLVPEVKPRRSLLLAWLSFAVSLVGLVGEWTIVSTWETGDCNINGALGFWYVLVGAALATPVITFIQHVRAPSGNVSTAQAVILYLLSLVMLAMAFFGLVPIIFSDAC